MKLFAANSLAFRTATPTISMDDIRNPYQGWYHIHKFRLRPDIPEEDIKFDIQEQTWFGTHCSSERIALVIFDISMFFCNDFTDLAICYIRHVMEFFISKRQSVILRFAYDADGDGVGQEPMSLFQIQRHMTQAGAALEPYYDFIVTWQGLFVGRWGEMHGSRYLDDVSIGLLANTLYHATKGKCFLAVRTPCQWHIILEMFERHGHPERMAVWGLYNDGMFGSATDLGTYPDEKVRTASLAWHAGHLAHVPFGGELVCGRNPVSYVEAVKDFRKMHVSYLNAEYDPKVLSHWTSERVYGSNCDGRTYIGLRLGYRFYVERIRVRKRGQHMMLRAEIRNDGFGYLCKPAEVVFTVQTDDGPANHALDCDPRQWRNKVVIDVEFPEELFCSGARAYLGMRALSGEEIQFANTDMGKYGVFLGEVVG